MKNLRKKVYAHPASEIIDLKTLDDMLAGGEGLLDTVSGGYEEKYMIPRRLIVH